MTFNKEVSEIFHSNMDNKEFIDLLNKMLSEADVFNIDDIPNYSVELLTKAVTCLNLLRTRNSYMDWATKENLSTVTGVRVNWHYGDEYILDKLPSFYKDSGLSKSVINSQSRRRLEANPSSITRNAEPPKQLTDNVLSLAAFKQFIITACAKKPMTGKLAVNYINQVRNFSMLRADYLTLIVSNSVSTDATRRALRALIKDMADSSYYRNDQDTLIALATASNKY